MDKKKSVCIIGKGPSVLIGNNSIYNDFDEIALIPSHTHVYELVCFLI